MRTSKQNILIIVGMLIELAKATLMADKVISFQIAAVGTRSANPLFSDPGIGSACQNGPVFPT